MVGGKFTAWDEYIFGVYLELEEGKHVVQEWTTTDWEEGYPASKLELTFKAVPKEQRLLWCIRTFPKRKRTRLQRAGQNSTGIR